ncbi:polysaccharide biosynthesis/export family protein [Hasllibacter sp. MH4015]|uniref:polysaccharide biosynthesis/export family protein n=1 Tax=Hasllibacter sp. MH4015 TaxID=2854029 RepID=UPI001CD44AA5|nr:polysaccharide biosynthesis/export family protein [Hasllibacter sp. MH4015]
MAHLPAFGKLILCVLATLAVAACDNLPRTAPVEREVVEVASGEVADFAVYPVTREFLPIVAAWPGTGNRHLGWIPTSGGARTSVIGTGDQLRITVWDSDNDSLLTNSDPSTVIEALTVAPDGTVFVPYVGNVEVAGLTEQLARVELQDRVDLVAPQAQVQLELVQGRANSVDLVGGVNNAGRFPMPDRNYTVLNLIADGGGVQQGMENPQIRLIRGGSIYGTSIDRLFAEPGLDTLLHGGDRVIVEEDRRYFLSLGAAGEQNQHRFPQDHLTALDAISIIGGVEGRRGNPGGVLVLREYPHSAVRPDARGPDQARVVFALDLTNADGLFSARNFRINPGDLVLVTESPVTGVQTIFGLVGSAFGLVNAANNATN